MISFGRGALSVALALSCCGCIVAQATGAGVSVDDPTAKFIETQRNSPGYRAKIQNSIVAYEKELDSHCKEVSLDFGSGMKYKILSPLYTDEKGAVVGGSWRETVPGTACGENRRFNVQVDVLSDGLEFTATFPGDAAADPDMQRSTLKSIELSFHTLGIEIKKNCHFEVLDTHLVGPAPTLQDNGSLTPWNETWDVRLCTRSYFVPVTYASDGQGIFIKISAAGIKLE